MLITIIGPFKCFLKNVWIKNKLAEVICCCLLVAY